MRTATLEKKGTIAAQGAVRSISRNGLSFQFVPASYLLLAIFPRLSCRYSNKFLLLRLDHGSKEEPHIYTVSRAQNSTQWIIINIKTKYKRVSLSCWPLWSHNIKLSLDRKFASGLHSRFINLLSVILLCWDVTVPSVSLLWYRQVVGRKKGSRRVPVNLPELNHCFGQWHSKVKFENIFSKNNVILIWIILSKFVKLTRNPCHNKIKNYT